MGSGRLWVSIVVSLLCLLSRTESYAQYDPNCYFPKIGEPGVIDTIYGSESNQNLSIVMNIGPVPDSSYGRMLFSGLPQNAPFLSAVNAGPAFDLHHLKVTSKIFDSLLRLESHQLVHLHSPRYLDLLLFTDGAVAQVYWGDESGTFDTSRKSILWPDKRWKYYNRGMGGYCTRLSQDSVDDLVYGAQGADDTMRLSYYRGGASLASQGQDIYPDSTAPMFWGFHKYSPTQGDFRGTGRNDLIAQDDFGNLFFYKNEQPFSLSNLVRAMFQDTLWTLWQSPQVRQTPQRAPAIFAAHVFRKTGPVDLVWAMCADSFLTSSTSPSTVYRGWSGFGTYRLTLDSSAYSLYAPGYYDFNLSGVGGGMAGPCGDLSGSGNPMLIRYASGPDLLDNFDYLWFYVAGDALDDKIDMEIFCDNYSGIDTWDSLTADGDNITDLGIGRYTYVSAVDKANGKTGVGTVQVVHGTTKIPAKSTSAVHEEPQSMDLKIFPNPLKNIGTISFTNNVAASTARIVLRDILGRDVHEESHRIGQGQQTLKIAFGELASGSYRVEVELGSRHLTKQVVIVK